MNDHLNSFVIRRRLHSLRNTSFGWFHNEQVVIGPWLPASPMAPAEIKAELAIALGANAQSYWRSLSNFLQGKMSRAEFEDMMLEKLDTPQLSKSSNRY
jgi:hypothetical protein